MAALQSGLVFNPKHCSLLIFSSNCSASAQDSHQHNSDQDAEAIFSLLQGAGLARDTIAQLVSTSGSTKAGLKTAIQEQIRKVTSDEEGLFVFVYCGGGCDLRDYGKALKVSDMDEEGFTAVDSDETKCLHSLVLKDFDLEREESYVSGGHIADMMTASTDSKPGQMLVILDCPCAEEIGKDLVKHLKGRLQCNLTLVVSQEESRVPHYLPPLGLSTFTFFLSKFLPQAVATAPSGAHATLYFKSMYEKVKVCCQALSSLRMIREELILKPGTATPEAKFVRIMEDASKVMERMEQIEDENQVDGQEEGMVGKFLQLYYKTGFFTRRVRLDNKAKDWVLAVMRGPLVELKEQDVLKDEVLSAAAGSMMESVATIQVELKADCISNSNIFIQAYIMVFAALSMHIEDLDIGHPALLNQAVEFYVQVLRAKELSTSDMEQLKAKIEKSQRA